MNESSGLDERPTILCVDDEPNVLHALERLLRVDGWRVLLATDGRAALDTLQREHVDVLICDQAMPGLSGTEVLRQAKAASPETVRILLTAHWSEGEVVLPAINEAEVFRVFPKPWHDEQVRGAAVEALGADPRTWAGLRRRLLDRMRGESGPCPDGLTPAAPGERAGDPTE
ncbi:MAG: response regulator [Phycisphaerae bacterium]|jgi:CheY-like chemotaxis protein